MNVVINGLGTANDENVTGIQRVCRELTLRLDELLKNEPEIHAEYLSKTGAKNVVVAPSDLHNIEFCELDGQKNKINALFRFPRYVKKLPQAVHVLLPYDACDTRTQQED